MRKMAYGKDFYSKASFAKNRNIPAFCKSAENCTFPFQFHNFIHTILSHRMKHVSSLFLVCIFQCFVLFSAAQHVGIGTSNPAAKLHVQSAGFESLRLQGPTAAATFYDNNTLRGYIQAWTDGITMSSAAGQSLRLYSNGGSNERLTIVSNGNVGINNSNPQANVHISSNAVEALRISGFNPAQTFYNGNNYVGYLQAYQNIMSLAADGTNRVGLFTVQTERLTILPNGNVGINNVAPEQKLDVAGNLKFTGALMPNGNTGQANQVLTSTGSGVPEWHVPGYSHAYRMQNVNMLGSQYLTVNGTYEIQPTVSPAYVSTTETSMLHYQAKYVVTDVNNTFGADTEFELQLFFRVGATVAYSHKQAFVTKNGRQSDVSISGFFPVTAGINYVVEVYFVKYAGDDMTVVSGGVKTYQ